MLWKLELGNYVVQICSVSCHWSLPGTGNIAAAHTSRFAAANLVWHWHVPKQMIIPNKISININIAENSSCPQKLISIVCWRKLEWYTKNICRSILFLMFKINHFSCKKVPKNDYSHPPQYHQSSRRVNSCTYRKFPPRPNFSTSWDRHASLAKCKSTVSTLWLSKSLSGFSITLHYRHDLQRQTRSVSSVIKHWLWRFYKL